MHGQNRGPHEKIFVYTVTCILPSQKIDTKVYNFTFVPHYNCGNTKHLLKPVDLEATPMCKHARIKN